MMELGVALRQPAVQIREEFYRITNKNLMDNFRAALHQHTWRLLRLFRVRRTAFSSEMDQLLNSLDQKSSMWLRVGLKRVGLRRRGKKTSNSSTAAQVHVNISSIQEVSEEVSVEAGTRRSQTAVQLQHGRATCDDEGQRDELVEVPDRYRAMDDDLNGSHQSLVPVQHGEPLSSNVNKSFQSRIAKLKQHHDKCSERYMASEEECNAAERQRTFLLHQRVLLDQQLAQLENHQSVLMEVRYAVLKSFKEGTDNVQRHAAEH
ncbi:hypothetical protein ABVT39_018406 [Epinephelus coioides]